MHEARPDVGPSAAEGHEADAEGKHQKHDVDQIDTQFEGLIQDDVGG